MLGHILVFVLISSLTSTLAQENLFSRHFNLYKGGVPGIDFLAATRDEVTPFERPLAEARQKLQVFLGDDLPVGAIFVCSSTEQRDSVYEPRARRMGYRWVLTVVSPQIEVQQVMERMRARMGGEIPPERMERLRQRGSDMQSRLLSKTAQELGYAILMTTLAPEREFRTSRLDDMNRSPLADWLDIGLASYAAGTLGPQLEYLRQHVDQSYPIEDVLFMSRPVIVPSFLNSGSGPLPPGPGSSDPMGMGAPDETQRRMSRSVESIPNDVQDRLMYDAQAASLFAHLLDKLGIDKLKEIVAGNREGKDVQTILEDPDCLGPDMEAAERDWLSWVRDNQVETRGDPNRKVPPQGPGPRE